MSRLDWIAGELQALRATHLERRLQTFVGRQGPTLAIDGRTYVNFGSNDYLDLAGDERLVRAACATAARSGWGAGASPLVVGRSTEHAELERELAAFERCEAALLFSTGYAANLAAVGALVGRGDVVFSDALNHASIVDGCRLSRAEVRTYPHADVAALEAMLGEAAAFRRRLIVTDGLFSMDGDVAPLAQLADAADRGDCMLIVDEAHATGVLGREGRGACEACGVEDRVDLRVGTLSKALGGVGGFVVGNRAVVEWLVNRARPYMFSTALPPAAAAASRAALDVVRGEPERRVRPAAAAEALRGALRARGWNVGPSTTQIVPLIVGDAAKTLRLAERLRARGFWVPPIRPPSVPAGSSRLRLCLTSGHTPEMIDGLLAALGDPT